jgi:hypothetical protein
LFTAALFSLALAFAALAQEREVVTPQRATEVAETFEQRVAEYLRRFPYQITYDYTLRFTGGDPRNFNRWLSDKPALVRAGEDIVPRTNNDTYYKAATLFLEDGPVVIESSAPTRDRFNSFQLVDDRNVNYRNIVFPAGKYTLHFGARPEEVEGEAIEVPSALSIVIARVEVRDKGDPDDVAAAKALFAGLRISGAPPSELPKLDLLSMYPADVAAEAHRRMDETFATVPFGRTVVGPGREPGRDVPYLYHAAGTKGGWGGPDPVHSAYEAILFDKAGNAMHGRNGTYAVTTDVPPVDGFWSVTVYDTERGSHLHPNAADRYHFNGTTARRNADGSVTLTFKRACEASDVNCLEVPAGRFDVVARYYLPHPEIVSGVWTFPKIERAR